jgi:hypothetical protein
MLGMPGKSPQKQVMCQSGYLVPEAFKKEHEVLMELLVYNIHKLVDNTIEYFEFDYDHLSLEEEDTCNIIEYLSCTIADQLKQDLGYREY